jgi:hypothetical protein
VPVGVGDSFAQLDFLPNGRIMSHLYTNLRVILYDFCISDFLPSLTGMLQEKLAAGSSAGCMQGASDKIVPV